MGEKHGIKEMCVMTPHTISPDTDSPAEAMRGDVGDEEKAQGFHRECAYIQCECGEMFTGRQVAVNEYKIHNPDIDVSEDDFVNIE